MLQKSKRSNKADATVLPPQKGGLAEGQISKKRKKWIG